MRIKSVVLASLLGISSGLLASQTLHITPNWQLLGATQDINTSDFENNCVDFIWAYDANGWKLKVANGKSYNIPASVQTLDMLHFGEGYWIKGNGNCDITLDNNITTENNTTENNETDIRIEFDVDVSSGTYDSLTGKTMDLSKTYYDVRYSSHDGLDVERFQFDNGTVIISKYDSSSNSWINDENDTYEKGSDDSELIINDGNFSVKFLDENSSADLNAIANAVVGKDIFSSNAVAYSFAYKRLVDGYEFNEDDNYQYKDYDAKTQYASLDEFITETRGAGWWQCPESGCDKGITFSSDANLSESTSGTLIEVEDGGTVTNDNAGTWEIRNIDGDEVLVTNITASGYDGSPIFKYDGTGVLRGEYEKAGSESLFMFVNEDAKDDFVNFINNMSQE